MFDVDVVIVSRHKSTVEYLKTIFGNAEVVDHLTPEDIEKIKGKIVVGNLPIDMIAELLKNGNRFVLVTLNVPRELRGKELSLKEVKKYCKLYEIVDLKLSEFVVI